jgi:hypothetical protein
MRGTRIPSDRSVLDPLETRQPSSGHPIRKYSLPKIHVPNGGITLFKGMNASDQSWGPYSAESQSLNAEQAAHSANRQAAETPQPEHGSPSVGVAAERESVGFVR